MKNYFSVAYITNPRRDKTAIYSALIKYGYSNFKLDILEHTSPNKSIEREQYYMDLLSPEYNLLKIAGSGLGYKHSDSSKLMMSENRKGEKHPMYGKVSALIGRTHSEETKTKDNKIGVKLSEETKAKIRAKKIGFKHSEETKEKLRINAALNSSKFVHSEEEKISKALSGENHLGTIPSEETKLKISQKLSSPVEVTDIETNTKIIYNTSSEAAKSFPCCVSTINRNIRTQKLYKNRYKIIKVTDIKSFSTFTKSILPTSLRSMLGDRGVEDGGSEERSNIKDINSKLGEGESPKLNIASLLKGIFITNLGVLNNIRAAALPMVKVILLKVYLKDAYIIGPSLARDRTRKNELKLDNWILTKGHSYRGVNYTLNLGNGLPTGRLKGVVKTLMFNYYYCCFHLWVLSCITSYITKRIFKGSQLTPKRSLLLFNCHSNLIILPGGRFNKQGRCYYSTNTRNNDIKAITDNKVDQITPAAYYDNAGEDKARILRESKSGVYR